MARKPLLIALFCLALIELGLFLAGFRNRHASMPLSPSSPALASDSLLPAPTLYIEPAAGFTWVDTMVNNAKKTVDMTMYELVDPTFSAALVQACQRGVKVSVILDASRERAANTPAYNQLAGAGPNCAVAWSNPQFEATHQKSLVLDGTTAVVMSFNLTSRFYAGTRDLALVDTDPSDIDSIEAVFRDDFGATDDFDANPPMGHNVIWSPATAQDDLLSLIKGANKTLAVENEELSAAVIVDALAAACKRGVQTQLAMTDTSPAYHANYTMLQSAGCGVHIGANNNTTLYIHAKAIVADLGTAAAIGYVGSINFSDVSMNHNRELGLYVHDPGALTHIHNTITADYNTFPTFAPNTRLPNNQAAQP